MNSEEPEFQTQPLLHHFVELRRRLTWSLGWVIAFAIASFILYDPIVGFVMSPFQSMAGRSSLTDPLFINSLFEGFSAKMKLSGVMGIVGASPFLLYHGVRFVFPGLRKREKWFVAIALFCSAALVTGGFYLSYFYIVPFTIGFMTSAGFIPNNVGILLNFQSTVFYVVQLIFMALLLFQLPILLEVLLALNLVSRKACWKASRYVVVGIFALSAVVTPPDIISQLSLGVPLVVLYFLTILIAKIFGFGKGL
ncbi:MAG: twin-arginine translocase subunit TatC [bacterium]|nr:twin-arginine translocase subunit TatC [bacterium]